MRQRYAGSLTRHRMTAWRSTTLAAAPTATISATTKTAMLSAAQVDCMFTTVCQSIATQTANTHHLWPFSKSSWVNQWQS